MTGLIGGSQARTIAEARWGSGGTSSTRTNRTGCFYYSCSGHGGFVIDERALTEQERAAMTPHLEVVRCVTYRDTKGTIRRLVHDAAVRPRSYEVYASWKREEFNVLLAEEDCAWCIPGVLAGIYTKDRPEEELKAYALDTFSRWYAESNHELVQACAQADSHASVATA